jgi:flavin-dependent dehydrogenase
VKALLRHRGSHEWVAADYLFAADGVDSQVVESLGLNDSRKLIMRTPLLEYYYADVQTSYSDSWIQFVGDGFNGVSGYMLHKPDYDGYNNVYEVSALPPIGSDLSCNAAMQNFLEHRIIKELLSGARLIKKMGCKWSIWSPIEAPARDRVILLGDAASFQEAENQGAIMCGYRAARAVIDVKNGTDGFSHYNRFWEESFEFNDPQVLQDTWKGFIFRYLGTENLNYVISLADGLFLDGYINHFKSGNTILEFIYSQMGRIKKERPDVAKKIIDFEKFKVEENIIGEV